MLPYPPTQPAFVPAPVATPIDRVIHLVPPFNSNTTPTTSFKARSNQIVPIDDTASTIEPNATESIIEPVDKVNPMNSSNTSRDVTGEPVLSNQLPGSVEVHETKEVPSTSNLKSV